MIIKSIFTTLHILGRYCEIHMVEKAQEKMAFYCEYRSF